MLPDRYEFWGNREIKGFPNAQRFPVEILVKGIGAMSYSRRGRYSDFPTIIDAGCGNGESLVELKKQLPQADLIGYELSEKAVERANEQIGFSAFPFRAVIQQDFFEVAKRELADVVIFEHVFTHFLVRDGLDEAKLAKDVASNILHFGGLVAITDWLRNDLPSGGFLEEQVEYWERRYQRDAGILGKKGLLIILPKDIKEKHSVDGMYSKNEMLDFLECGRADRVVRHYTYWELVSMFSNWDVLYQDEMVHTTSSGNKSRGINILFRKN